MQMPTAPASGLRSRPLGALLLSVALVAPASAADAPTGEALYRKQCASCHGANGEGVKDKFPHPLAGDRSPAQLAKLIARTMPEDAVGSCVGPSADKVAAFVFEAFYSPAAQARNEPPRLELARLTVRQYRNAVTDLLGSYRGPSKYDEQRGLKAEYFSGRNMQPDKRAIDRVDPEVRFDWKLESPGPKIEADQFAARWSGSVIAPETGEYEFVVRTEHGTRLWVNDPARPLVDAWVKSGTDTEHRGSVFLLGGRAYHLKLEFTKAKQGVDDSKKGKKPKPVVPASIALEWKLPRGVPGVVPQRFLTPNRASERFVVSTPFPPDDRSLGWERGTTVTKDWDAAATDAALQTAAYVVARLNDLTGVRDGDPERAKKVRAFAAGFAERAFRRPLTAEQKQLYVDRQFDAAKDVEAAVKRTVLLVLKSPRFLYREVGGSGADPYDAASRLSFALWDAPPDDVLVKAAVAGKLATREQLKAQAERMAADPRARAKIREFLLAWLKVDQVADVAKDPKKYPGFDPALVADLRASLEMSLDDAVWGEKPDFRRLLLSDEVYLNGRLAQFYGAKLPADAGFQKVKLNADRRAGVLTHPYLMAAFAYTGTTSPIHRGVFVARGLLGINLRPPQEAFTPLAPDLHPTLTTRERVALQTRDAACQACHGTINALGFTMERFDAVGRYRERDGSKPVDSTGGYVTRSGAAEAFADARALGAFLAGSEEAHAAFVSQMFHHLAKQPVRAYGTRTPDELRAAFAAGGFDVRKLAVEIATTAAAVEKAAVEKGATPSAAASGSSRTSTGK